MDISLPPEWERFISQELREGIYPSAEDVVCAGLLRLKQDREAGFPELPDTVEQLEAELLESIQTVEKGHVIYGEESLSHLRNRIKARRPNG